MPKAKAKPQSEAPRPGADRVIPEDEKHFVGQLLSRIQRAVELRKHFDETTLPALRRLTWGTEKPASDDATVRVNLIFATIATLLPHIYAKNPEIAVSPSEAVDEAEYDKWKKFCKTAQVFLNRMFEEMALKRRSKSNVRSAMTTSIGWLKLTFQENLAGDPIVMRRVNDMQDNLQKIEYLAATIKDAKNLPDVNAKREELKNQLRAMMDSNEVKVFKGFALDRVQTEDVFLLDESIVEFDDYVHADMLAHRIWYTDEKYETAFGHKPMGGTTEYGAPGSGGQDEEGKKVELGTGSAKVSYRAVFEVWDKTANTIYTVAMGAPGYVRAPYIPKAMPERWYNFYALGFNLVEGRFRPLSDVELLRKLQDEYSTTRYLYAEARKEAIPTRVFRKSGNLTPEDIELLSKRRARDWIGIEGNPQTPLAQEFLQLEGVKIDPAAYDVTLIRNDMDMMVGLSDASRANLIQAKTATEAEIMRQALMTRVAERQDANEDVISDMARSMLEMALQKFTPEEMQQLAGAGAEWPRDLKVEEIFHKIRVTVRAGSTGRPNQQKERESWTQLMPVITDTAKQVAELRAQGAFDLADTQVELLRETLRRFDERLDIDSIIPPLKRDEKGQPQAAQNALAQAQQAQEQMAALQKELQACQQKLQECEQALVVAKHAENARIAEADAKKAIEVAKETGNAEAKRLEEARKENVDHERMRLERESQERVAAENSETERYKAILTMASSLYVAEMKPGSAPVGADGKPTGEAPPEPNVEQVIERVAKFAERVTEVADRVAGITS